MIELGRAGQLPETPTGAVEVSGQPYRRSQHQCPLATVRLGQRTPNLGRRLAQALGGPPEVFMTGRSSTPPPGPGHCLAKASVVSRY